MSNRLKELRKKKKISLRELQDKVNIDHATLSRLENDKSPLTQEHMEVLSRYYNVSIDFLIGKLNYQTFTVEKIPVYSKLFGGSKILREEYFLRHEYVPGDVDLTDCVYLLCSDNTMTNAGILEGDLLLVKLKTSVDHNNVVVAAKYDDAGIVRRLMIAENQKILLADSNQPPIIFDDKWMVIGKVLKISRDVK